MFEDSLDDSSYISSLHVDSGAVPAHFIRKYSLYSVKRGDSAKLVCEAFGSRPITIQWLRQDSSDSQLTPLTIPMFGTTEFAASGSSSFSSSEQVTKFNPFSSSSSSPPPPPPPPLPDQRSSSSRGSEATSAGSQSARFSAFQKDFPGPDERTSFELHILSTQLSDSALYVCKISNEFGDDTKNMELTILGNAFCFSPSSHAPNSKSRSHTFLCNFEFTPSLPFAHCLFTHPRSRRCSFASEVGRERAACHAVNYIHLCSLCCVPCAYRRSLRASEPDDRWRVEQRDLPDMDSVANGR